MMIYIINIIIAKLSLSLSDKPWRFPNDFQASNRLRIINIMDDGIEKRKHCGEFMVILLNHNEYKWKGYNV